MRLSEKELNSVIFQCAINHGVSPELIKTRLLSDQDKDDLREGFMTIEALSLNTELWKNAGMPDYAHGKDIPYRQEKNVNRGY